MLRKVLGTREISQTPKRQQKTETPGTRKEFNPVNYSSSSSLSHACSLDSASFPYKIEVLNNPGWSSKNARRDYALDFCSCFVNNPSLPPSRLSGRSWLLLTNFHSVGEGGYGREKNFRVTYNTAFRLWPIFLTSSSGCCCVVFPPPRQ